MQARQVYEQYLKAFGDLDEEDETKDFEDIPEPLLEVPIDFVPVEKSVLTGKASRGSSSPLGVSEIKSEPWTDNNANEEFIQIQPSTESSEVKQENTEHIDNTDNESATPAINLNQISLSTDITTADPTYEEER